MKKVLYVMAVAWFSFSGYGQTNVSKAIDYYNMGCDMVARKNYKVAITDFTEALKRDPEFKQAYENRGVSRYYLLDFEGAIEDYSKALEIDPADYSTYGRRGWTKYAVKDYKGAIEDLTHAIAGVKDEDKYYNERGEAKYMLRDYEGAIDDFSKVINSFGTLRFEKSKAYFWRGLSEIEMGQKDIGCGDLHKAAKKGFEKAFEVIKGYCE